MSAKLQAVILDWAGTTVDYGSRAPTQVFLEIFRRRGVEITVAEARGPMGMAKREHISAVISLPRVAQLWQQVHGRAPVDNDVQTMYDEFLPLQLETLARGSEMIPGVVEAIAECRQMGLKIGSTTGYTRALMEVVAPPAAKCGYSPDCIICSDDVSTGRPAPWMNFRAAEILGVYPLDAIIAVDDTPVGIAAGRNAGCVTVGVSQTGNALGLSQAEVEKLPPAELAARLQQIGRDFLAQGAHYVLRSVSELPNLIRKLNG
ncbi:phosphonoacetaldehyde hydrolase [Anatilimnocola sp. NA78]|uniref:phosphonoacetaldehyde hydrolase n=1 Tax=Anatilimnocola sp. NA78 TaxID=3415683 RepID=UPI003CE47607